MIKLLESKETRRVFVMVLVALMLVGVTAVAYAITITVDGSREAAWGGGGSANDPNEVDVTNDGVDVQIVEWTNDTTNFYFLIETYAAVTWDLTGFTDAELILCINNDNNVATGSSLPGQCLGTGYDRYIQIVGPTPTINVFDSNFNPVAATTDIAFNGTITEISIDAASLGLSSANCGSMLMGVYFDGQTQDPDDNVLDGGDIPITCGSPTAISLQNIAVSGQSVAYPFALGAFGLIIISTGLLINRKRKNVE